MSEHDARGDYVWHELLTPDPEGAKSFYSEVIGWSTAPFDQADRPYWLWMKGEEAPVGGVMELPEEAREQGAPPHWMGYLSVDDVEATAARAEELGGRVLAGPDDMEMGWWAVVEDPQGAVFALWKSKEETGDGPPALSERRFSWAELGTTDDAAAFEFYADLFGWDELAAHDMGEELGTYREFGHGDRALGGMFTKTSDMPGPPGWLHYILVEDLDATLEAVVGQGGQVVGGPREVPGGDRIAQCLDPQGAAFALHERQG